MKLLLVEDEGYVRAGLKLLLQALVPDAAVTAVGTPADARRALDAAVGDPFSFIFLDIKLGTESGLDLLDQIKASGIETPVIMLSNVDDRETVHEALDRGAYGFLRKQDDDASQVTRAMELVLQGGVYIPRNILTSRTGSVPPPAHSSPVSTSVKKATKETLNLSPRLFEAAYYVAAGLQYKQIAAKMNVSDAVATEYAQTVYKRLGVRNRQAFMTMLNQQGLQIANPFEP